MLEFLPKELREGLEAARLRQLRRKSRLRVQVGEAVFPVLRMWETGFTVEAGMAPRLRGLVDIYDGPRHVFQCLIVASSGDGTEITCEFKRHTVVSDRAPLDFWRGENAPAGYLPKA
ncbi:MAG: hypothetical protein QM656_08360 [Paracoccaceae bacterium]